MKSILLLILFLVSTVALSQNKIDYIWLLGNDQELGPEIRNLEFDFNNRPFQPEIRSRGLNFDRNNVSICDKEGELLFYSNGCAIASGNHELMLNGDGINPGEFFEEYWFGGTCQYGYPGRQDMLILKDPRRSEGYFVIHKRLERHSDGGFDPINLSYSYVDLAMNNGLGVVTEKNVDFYSIDKFLWSYLTAIYQENGRDWWIVNPGADSRFYVFSLDLEGLRVSHIQEAFHEFDSSNSSASGDAKFSPDGQHLAYFNQYDGLLLYKFNRENGELTDVRKLTFPRPSQASFSTCEWSPNSRFLYLATEDSIWQVEVSYDKLDDGKVFIAEHNGVNDPFSTRFFVSTLGPDCRIYIRPGSGSYSFHVIHHPNRKGQACDLVQQGLKLPEISSSGSFPNYPRFRVDEKDKCDPGISTIFGQDVYWRRDLITYPNPTSKFVNLEFPEGIVGDVYILDMQGKLIERKLNICSTHLKLDVSSYPSGVYSIEFLPKEADNRVIYTSKLYKQD